MQQLVDIWLTILFRPNIRPRYCVRETANETESRKDARAKVSEQLMCPSGTSRG